MDRNTIRDVAGLLVLFGASAAIVMANTLGYTL